ncbi:CRY1 [Symbiodinium natans]|uniref:CRY1 protein n=1 Tax=Symbiodinium natans TaxID=878477 RepID=A0A812MIU5_9DINO|nr:CRY1 [Symbiodinium natans]
MVHLVFAWSEEEDAAEGEWQLAGTAAAFFLHHAVAALDASIQSKYGNAIRVRRGSNLAEVVLAAAQEAGAEEVLTSSAVQPSGPQGLTVDREVARSLQAAGIKLRTFDSFLLCDIKQVRVDLNTYRGHFGTLTPFHHACFNQPPVAKPLPEPTSGDIPERPGAFSGWIVKEACKPAFWDLEAKLHERSMTREIITLARPYAILELCFPTYPHDGAVSGLPIQPCGS